MLFGFAIPPRGSVSSTSFSSRSPSSAMSAQQEQEQEQGDHRCHEEQEQGIEHWVDDVAQQPLQQFLRRSSSRLSPSSRPTAANSMNVSILIDLDGFSIGLCTSRNSCFPGTWPIC